VTAAGLLVFLVIVALFMGGLGLAFQGVLRSDPAQVFLGCLAVVVSLVWSTAIFIGVFS